MKKSAIVLWFVFGAYACAFAQGMEFFNGNWEEALAKAQAEEKPIFVDAYTTWCGPCKVMSQTVFPDPRSGELFNQNFVNIKIDMEGEEGLRFQKKYPVNAYPTLYFIDFDGKVLKKVIGAQRVDGFVQIGRSVLESVDRSGGYAEAYEKGDRSPELIYKYVRSLNRAGKSSLRVANDYLRTAKDLSNEINLKIIFETAMESDSRVFDWLTEYRGQMNLVFSTNLVDNRIYEACRRTADKALKMNNADLLSEAKEKMKQHLPERAKAFGYRVEMEQALAGKDAKAYLKALNLFAKNAGSEPAMTLRQMALDISKQQAQNMEALESAVELARIAAEKTGHSASYIDLAELMLQKGDRSGAKAAAEKAKSLAENESSEAKKNVEQFMLKLG